ncbi:hypothetical protein N0V90_002327 [Kalmusia sp. IMI 367209]|nr:hypothetical protein N0V90_002327 [Kalmusia sp. IMI 367209]
MAHVSSSDSIPDEDRAKTTFEDVKSKDYPSAPSLESKFSEEIDALRRKILELETRQAQHTDANPMERLHDSNVISEMERFKRMEACLDKHRKEWEVNVGPGLWDLHKNFTYKDKTLIVRELHFDTQSWRTCDTSLMEERRYERPNVFDQTHKCNVDDVTDILQSVGEKDDYDMTIDWGNRRDRLRKTF